MSWVGKFKIIATVSNICDHGACYSLQWHNNECDCVSNHRRLDCLLKRLFRQRSKKTSMQWEDTSSHLFLYEVEFVSIRPMLLPVWFWSCPADVTKWNHFPRYWPFNSPMTGEFINLILKHRKDVSPHYSDKVTTQNNWVFVRRVHRRWIMKGGFHKQRGY